MTFVLSPALALALGCAVLPILLLWAAARVRGTTTLPGRRLVNAEAVSLGVWLLGMAVWHDTMAATWEDWLAAVLILFGGVLATFTLWSLLAWGFTSSLLLTLSRADSPLTLDDWIVRYTRGGDSAVFTRNRLGVLLRLGLARETPDGVKPMPGWAAMAGASALCLRALFGLRT
jgi:hypothetical protein